jgi:hypothetical protein
MRHDPPVQPGILCPEGKIVQKRLMKIDGSDRAVRTEPGEGEGLHTGPAPDIKYFSLFEI